MSYTVGRGLNGEDDITNKLKSTITAHNVLRKEANMPRLELRVFCSQDFDGLEPMLDFLSYVIGVIGPHGGAMMNMMMSAHDGFGFTVEIASPQHTNFIFQYISQLQRLEYTYVLADSVDQGGNMDVATSKVLTAFHGALERLHTGLLHGSSSAV